jgi:N-acylglucosamine 2-epimerase
MSFWEVRTEDKKYGGYLNGFNRRGDLTDTDKYIWVQARQLWMFSALYNQIEKRPLWLQLASSGRDFLVKHAYAGQGRWHYLLDRSGDVKRGPESIFADHFVLEALCEFSVASGSDEDLPLILETYTSLEQRVKDPEQHEFARFPGSALVDSHSVYMITVHVAGIAAQVLGKERVNPLIDYCLEKVLYVFAKEDRQLLFEYLDLQGNVIDNDKAGRQINPGHVLESMWFCIEEGKERKDRAVTDRAIQIADWIYRAGHDAAHGGVLTFLDASGQEPDYPDWHKQRNIVWDEKVWWVHSEALYALALMASETNREEYWRWFRELHAWCRDHFYDPEYGEWYMILRRNGSPRITDKGGMQKAAYHLPRALLMIMKLFESDSV